MRAERRRPRVELQVEALRVERAPCGQQRAAEIDTVRACSGGAGEARSAASVSGTAACDVKTDLLAVQQQLVSVQELTGQSQQPLTELRGRLEEQARQPVPVLGYHPWSSRSAGRAVGKPAGPGPEQMYDLAYQQYRASRYGTARQAFREFLRVFPTHERAPRRALLHRGVRSRGRTRTRPRRCTTGREDLSDFAAGTVGALQAGLPRRATR